ncbi:tRNA nucleotidyltransferas-like protein [Calycina marina]|uniref:tRNA nucleotidyltransferas-like protein n=1 Tax=Calycina marina TaxID=1763456 RepID=A0A9P7Z1N7_9HELO|nr:tRNA nucleotidyltransferas-like protein [Calycina marina]
MIWRIACQLPRSSAIFFTNKRVAPANVNILIQDPMKRRLSDSASHISSKRTRMETAKISLLPEEEQLSRLLLDASEYIDKSGELDEKVVLRFAGGWIRDKLLGIQSNDIDVAINIMTGENFGIKLKEYVEISENVKKHGLRPKDLGSFHNIKKNPEQSKHLETTTVKIFGRDVDFVNLRKEVYAGDSRNPTMEFGTPEEDAERRDATINALFYNIHSGLVEDFTGGLKDLRAQRITTPMDPEKTFNDDPLRVLRLIRFASRLGFTIDPNVGKWMGDASVAQNLKMKISRERVGIELGKMLKDKSPVTALKLMDRLGLYSTVFTDPAREVPIPDSSKWSIAYNLLSTLKDAETPGSVYHTLVRSDDAKFQAWILAAIVPWGTVEKPKKEGVKAIENEPYSTDIIRRGVALDSKLCAMVTGAFRNRTQITDLKNAIGRSEPWTNQRDVVGMMIRGWKSDWKLHALYALLVEADSDKYGPLIQGWQKFLDHIEKMELMDVATEKYPLTGKDLQKALNEKPGIWVGKALDVCMRWRLKYPTSQNLGEAIEDVKSQLSELKKN